MFTRVSTIALLIAVIHYGRAASVAFEGESGTIGSDFTNGIDGAVQHISISTDRVNNGNPANANRVATYTVTFPDAGTYQLYARVRVGPDTWNDDSLFYASSFGTKSPTTDSDWILVNGLGSAGFNNSTEAVTGGGTLGSGMWKWINLSQFTSQPGFTVGAGNLTQTFQIGARENGLDVDKFVFGTEGCSFTVAELDAGGTGAPPSATIDATRHRPQPDHRANHFNPVLAAGVRRFHRAIAHESPVGQLGERNLARPANHRRPVAGDAPAASQCGHGVSPIDKIEPEGASIIRLHTILEIL
jgi:endo-1,4-beta-xylanase